MSSAAEAQGERAGVAFCVLVGQRHGRENLLSENVKLRQVEELRRRRAAPIVLLRARLFNAFLKLGPANIYAWGAGNVSAWGDPRAREKVRPDRRFIFYRRRFRAEKGERLLSSDVSWVTEEIAPLAPLREELYCLLDPLPHYQNKLRGRTLFINKRLGIV
jgi:hypothetical protein